MDRVKPIDYDKFKRQKKARWKAALALENTFRGHAAGRRPRDPEKEKLLTAMDRARLARYIETGKLRILGPRHWEWRIGRPDLANKPD